MAEADLFEGNRPRGILEWGSTVSSNEPLTAELMGQAMKNLRERAERERRAPRGPCGCTCCVVHPKTRERLQREGGYARCGNCFGGFYIDPPDARG